MRVILLGATLAACSVALAAPLLPPIVAHDFNFGAYNQMPGAIEWSANGAAPDTLVYTTFEGDHEVSAYWPAWPNPPMVPVWDLTGPPSFGGDFALAVQFTGQDAPQGPLDVSLTGTGLNTAPGAPDLEIWGTVVLPSGPLTGLLWALDLNNVSLYGYSGRNAYNVEGTGTIVGGLVPAFYNLIGQPGAVRGSVDFITPPPGWLPAGYNPVVDPRQDLVRADYSGETGVTIPEPASLGLLLAGLASILRRR